MMLPGVECARRRGLRKNRGGGSDSTAIRSLCLYTRNLQSTSTSIATSVLQEKSMLKQRQTYPDEKLGRSAREAKRRLDEKFTARSIKSENHKRKCFLRGLFQQLRF